MRFIFIFLLIPLSAYSGDAQHRSIITNLALASSIDRHLKNIFWISNTDFTSKSNEFFVNSSGATVIVANKLLSSGYDADISYDVSEFYKKNNYKPDCHVQSF